MLLNILLIQAANLKGFKQNLQPKNTGVMKKMLDSMCVLVNDGTEYQFYPDLVESMNTNDEILLQSSNYAWQGMIDYFVNNTSEDQWGSCNTTTGNPICENYQEANPTALNVEGIIIFEPCNYVSNVAYYRVVKQIVDKKNWQMSKQNQIALKQGFSALAMGSAFWHGSHTYLGYVYDNVLISIISYIGFQTSVENLQTDSPFIRDLNETARNQTAAESTQTLSEMYINSEFPTWQKKINATDIPEYFLTFTGILTYAIDTAIPLQAISDKVISGLEGLFPLPQEDLDFIRYKFMPLLRNLKKSLTISIDQRFNLACKLIGTFIKLLYSFVFQEHFFPNPFNKYAWFNELGASLMPRINSIANKITGFQHTDQEFQDGKNVYPGAEKCNNESPHAKWHQESANGLYDLIFLCDYLKEITNLNVDSKENKQISVNAIEETIERINVVQEMFKLLPGQTSQKSIEVFESFKLLLENLE